MVCDAERGLAKPNRFSNHWLDLCSPVKHRVFGVVVKMNETITCSSHARHPSSAFRHLGALRC